MKKIIFLFFAAALMFASCNKQLEKEPEPVIMTYDQLAKEIGSQNAYEVFDKKGLTVVDQTVARGRKIKEGATVAVWFESLTLIVASGVITYSTAPGSNWGGVTKFVSQTSNDGALGIWNCNRYWAAEPEPTVTCSDSATSGYFLRAFTSNNTTAEVHISQWVAG